jgi:hypothetical protein
VTLFRINADETGEQMILNILEQVDLHHGEYSHDPAWSELDVYGTRNSPDIEAALRECGVTRIDATGEGFIAWR